MAIQRPLDPDAVAAADDRFYEAYPDMVDENGNRTPLSGTNNPDDDKHEDWVRFYNEALEEDGPPEDGGGGDEGGGGEDEGGGDVPPSPEPSDEFPTTPPDPCEDCPKSWISLDLTYMEGEDCAGIKYSALTTAAYEQPTTTNSPKRWEDIPAGTCLFGEFDFHETGAAVTKPRF